MSPLRYVIPFLGLCTAAHANDFAAAIAAHPAACGNLVLAQNQDLRLAARAQEGELAFMNYVRFKRPIMQWANDEAIDRARAAADSPCGRAMGLRPIDGTLFPNLVSAHDERRGDEAQRTAAR